MHEETIRESGDYPRDPRSADNRLFWVAVLGPLLTFMMGLCTGAVGTVVLFKDHEHRIAKVEAQSAIFQDVVTALKVKGIIK